MNFDLTDEQRMLRETAASFADREIAPRAIEIDKTGRFPAEIVGKLAELGLLGVPFPEDAGGAGMDARAYVLAIEEISRASAAVGAIVAIHTSVVADPIFRFGTPAQKERWLGPLARGEALGCFALTEAGAGSDAAAIRTSARDEGDRWIVTGSKLLVTNAAEAGVCLAFATSDPSRGSRGVQALLVPMDAPGVSLGQHEEKLGMRGTSTREVVLDGVAVPKADQLGEKDAGFTVAMAALDAGRIGIAAQAVGIGRAAVEAATRYARERRQFGKAIAEFQAIQWMIADSATEIDAARLLTWRAAWRKDRGLPFAKEAAMAKLYAAEAAMRAATRAIQVHGGYGVVREYGVERCYRDAKVAEVYEGTSEIQRLVIARRLVRENAIGA